jgi:monofunctional biosynthetic peptidoglycan transglycosylase
MSDSNSDDDALLIFDFSQRDSVARWVNVDDPVMGGVSTSRIRPGDGAGVFSGVVSLENNGGFASVRSRFANPPDDLRDYDALRTRVRGDGKTYIFSLQTTTEPRLNYWQRFRTVKGEWIEAILPLREFIPVFRGFTPRGAPALDARNVSSYGVFIADKQTGPFKLEIEWIQALKTPRLA